MMENDDSFKDEGNSSLNETMIESPESSTSGNTPYSQKDIEAFLKVIKQQSENTINEKTREITKDLEDEKSNIISLKKDLESKIENSKLSTIETIGIFVALFTFISVDFQVFRSYRDLFAISGLTLILLGSIVFLLYIFDFFIQRKIKSKTKYFFWFIGIVFISVGILLFNHAKIEDFEEKASEIKSEVKSDIMDYKNNLEDNFYTREELNNFILESRKNESILNCLKYKERFSTQCFEN